MEKLNYASFIGVKRVSVNEGNGHVSFWRNEDYYEGVVSPSVLEWLYTLRGGFIGTPSGIRYWQAYMM